jgi:CheY-like chemotaxis protein
MSRRELGEILREADLITEAQLAQALNLQRAYGERLASVLVRQRILTEKFAVTYLGRQIGVPAVDLSKQDIDLGLLDLVPLRLCERHMIFPVRVDGTRLQVAMAEPTDQLLVAEIESKTGVRLQPMIALEASVKNAILEARRALRDGRRVIQPNVLGAREADEAATPFAPFPAATDTPAELRVPLPLRPLAQGEPTVVESLAGAPLATPAADARRVARLTAEPPPPAAPRARAPEPPTPARPAPPSAPVRPASDPTPAAGSPPAAPASAARTAPPAPAAPPAARRPSAPPTPSVLPAPARSSAPAAARHPLAHVLVVDDDEMVLHLVSQLLEGADMTVRTARGGREALHCLRERAPDLVVLDGMLPDVHGFEICRQIKNSERFRHIPVVLVSAVHRGWRFAADVQERYGADAYVEKPFEPFDLLRRVEVLLRRVPPAAPDAEEQVNTCLKAGVAALKQGQLEEAVQAFESGLEAGPQNDLLHYYLGMTYEKRGMLFHAIDHYEQAVNGSPHLYDAIVALASLYEQHQFRFKAAEMWELALRATSDDAVRDRIKRHLVDLL